MRPCDARHCFVTGGTGILGKALLDAFEVRCRDEPSLTVTVLSRDPDQFFKRHPRYESRPWLALVKGGLHQPMPRLNRPVTDVIHAAADTHASGHPLDWFDQIVSGTRQVLDFAAAHGARRMLFVSSGAIYGSPPPPVDRLTEDMPFAPLTTDERAVYGQAKRTAEHLCRLYTSERRVSVVIARCFALSGPYIPIEGPYAFGNFVRDSLAGGPIRIAGDGSAVRSYLDVRDAARWMLELLSSGNPGDAYNVGSDEPITILSLAERIRDQLAPQALIEVGRALSTELRSVYVPGTEKARALGLRPEYSLSESIAAAAQFAANCA